MPNLVAQGLGIRNARVRRVAFKDVRIGQIFYSNTRWYQRRTKQKAWPADCPDTDHVHFRQTMMVWVLDETLPSRRARQGMTFDEFINQAAS